MQRAALGWFAPTARPSAHVRLTCALATSAAQHRDVAACRVALAGQGAYAETHLVETALEHNLKVGIPALPSICSLPISIGRPAQQSIGMLGHARLSHQSCGRLLTSGGASRYLSVSSTTATQYAGRTSPMLQVVPIRLPTVNGSYHCCTPTALAMYKDFIEEDAHCTHSVLLHAVSLAICSGACPKNVSAKKAHFFGAT